MLNCLQEQQKICYQFTDFKYLILNFKYYGTNWCDTIILNKLADEHVRIVSLSLSFYNLVKFLLL